MIRVYNRNDLNNRVDDIIELLECNEHLEINGLNSLTFSIPAKSESKKYFVEDDATKYIFSINNRFYYFILKELDTDNQKINIECRAVLTLMDKLVFIPIYPIQVAQTPKSVMQYVLDNFQDLDNENNYFEFKLFTDDELSQRGMTWVSEQFDILNGFDYVSGYDMIGNCIELAGRGELYFENFKFAIVERIGKDTDITWDKQDNLSTLSVTKDYDSLMNVILIEGKDGMPLDIKEFPNSVIVDTDSVQKYGIRRGHILYSDIDNKDDLKRRGMWEIDDKNPDRVSIPKLTITCDSYNVKDLNLGDSVNIVSIYDGINESRRIVTHEINWLERAQDKYVLGDKALTELQLLAKLEATRQTVSNIADINGNVDTSFVNLIVSAIEGRNRCTNSKFSIFNDLSIPEYWQTQNAYVTSEDARFGTFSLGLVDKGIAISDLMNFKNWENESDLTLIQIWHKGSFEIVVAETDDEGNLDNDNPIIIPHQTRYSSDKIGLSQFSSTAWSTTPAYLVVDNLDIPENGNFRIIIQGVTTEQVLIGGVYIGPGNLSQIKLYSDGPHSDRFDEGKGTSDVEFTRERNEKVIQIQPNSEAEISDIELEASENTQLNMELVSVVNPSENDSENLSIRLRIYDNLKLKYDYPFYLPGRPNTLSLSRVLERIDAGSHILNFKILNEGTMSVEIPVNEAVFSMKGKFVKLAEQPPIPVINETDLLNFNTLNIDNAFSSLISNITIFEINDEVRLEYL